MYVYSKITKKELKFLNLLKYFSRRKENFQTQFLLSKRDKDSTRKEYYGPISLMKLLQKYSSKSQKTEFSSILVRLDTVEK